MPNITTADTFTKDTTGLSALSATPIRTILFAGSSVGTTCAVQYTDDTGTARTVANGVITALPTSLKVYVNIDLQIVTTGSPNFNVTVLKDNI